MATRICMIRHGETDWNKSRLIQGQIDIPLNENGKSQAMSLGVMHGFCAVYSSDLSRAHETARMLAGDAEVIRLATLRERHHGIFQGITASEALQRYPEHYARYKSRDPDHDLETGESLTQFARRIDDALGELIMRHSGETFAIVTHAGVLDVVYRKATARPLSAPRDFAIRNCSLNWFRHDTEGLHLESWDERSAHMESIE